MREGEKDKKWIITRDQKYLFVDDTSPGFIFATVHTLAAFVFQYSSFISWPWLDKITQYWVVMEN